MNGEATTLGKEEMMIKKRILELPQYHHAAL
jgi:hypothetical protein